MINKASQLIDRCNDINEIFRARLVQTGEDEFHLETIDGNVVMDTMDSSGIKKQLSGVDASTDGDGIEDPDMILFNLTQAMPFDQLRGQVISQLVRVNPKKFRKLNGGSEGEQN